MPDFYVEYKAKLEGNVKLDLEKIIQVEKKTLYLKFLSH